MNSLMKEHANHLDKESLKTFLCEAEFEINNRHLSMETINDPLSNHLYHQVFCSQERQGLRCLHLVRLREKTSTVARKGDVHSI